MHNTLKIWEKAMKVDPPPSHRAEACLQLHWLTAAWHSRAGEHLAAHAVTLTGKCASLCPTSGNGAQGHHLKPKTLTKALLEDVTPGLVTGGKTWSQGPGPTTGDCVNEQWCFMTVEC